jgi:hypothetical protein
MKPNESQGSDYSDRFKSTQWSVVLLSPQTHVPSSRTAVADPSRLYWCALYAFVCRLGHPFLREGVARTVTDHKIIDEEIHALCEAVIASQGRPGP